MPALTVTRIRELFILDRTNWVLIWRVSPSQSVSAGQVAGCLDRKGYRRIRVDGKEHRAHKLIWAYVHGEFTTNVLDHINHSPTDNRIVNLRPTTNKGNGKNVPLGSANTSGVMGVVRHKAAGKWQAQICDNGKPIYLGLFTNKNDAIKARRAAEKKYGFHKNHGK